MWHQADVVLENWGVTRMSSGDTHESDSLPDERRENREQVVPKLVSAAAIVIAAVHVAVPSLSIDATTLALLGVAALPWLAPILKSITLPGGFGLVLQDLKQEVGSVKEQVQESSRRVEDLASRVQELLFEGDPIATERKDEISNAVAGFRSFLSNCGLPVPAANPSVRVDSEAQLPYYVGGAEPQIVILLETSAEDTYRLYAHHVLGEVYHGRSDSPERLALQYGLAFYFTASYEKTAPVFDKSMGDLSLKSALENESSGPFAMRTGAAWALTFWGLRDLMNQPQADEALANAWVRGVGRRGNFKTVFAKQLLDVIRGIGEPGVADNFRAVLRKEGVAV
jgi:hypothetical protein